MGPILAIYQPGTYETYVILSLELIPTWKVDATTTKLGWTTYIAPFSKWPPAKWNCVFAYYSASRIDKILVSKPMFFSGWRIQWWHWKIHILGLLLANSELKMAVLEINRNYINWFMGPMEPTCTRNYVFAYNWASRIDRDKILLSVEVISWF